ncbi:MAG: fumarate hydratase [Mucilaginibacter sp.]
MQKAPFSPLFSSFTLKKGFLLSAFCILLCSCHMNPNMQTPGQAWLQGEWQQDSVADQKQLISYSLYHIKFDCDSFFMTIRTFSKVNYGVDSCTSKGYWIEYTAGHYEQRHDTLYLKGDYTNPDFTLKTNTDCLHSGVYKEIFKITQQSDSVIRFASTSGVIPLSARRIKRTTCTVKPL